MWLINRDNIDHYRQSADYQCLPWHLPDTYCRSCRTWIVWSETSFQLQEKKQTDCVKWETRGFLSSSVQTHNKCNSRSGGYGFCQGCHCCPGSSLRSVGVTRRSALASGPHVIAVLQPLLAFCVLPKHGHFQYNLSNGESMVMRCKEAKSFSENSWRPEGFVFLYSRPLTADHLNRMPSKHTN